MSVTLPTVLMLLLGVILKRQRMVDDKFTGQATRIIFNITLPILLFLNITSNPVDFRSQMLPIMASVVGTLLLFLGRVSRRQIYCGKDRAWYFCASCLSR